MFFNTLIVPGLAVPGGTSLYEILSVKIFDLEVLYQNFYLVFSTSDFFVIFLIQQISFGCLGTALQIGGLLGNHFSPTIIVKTQTQSRVDRIYFQDDGNVFNYGFSYAQIITVLAILFIYS